MTALRNPIVALGRPIGTAVQVFHRTDCALEEKEMIAGRNRRKAINTLKYSLCSYWWCLCCGCKSKNDEEIAYMNFDLGSLW